jgi:hypothetical protein
VERLENSMLARRYRQLEMEIVALDAELTALVQMTMEYQRLKTVDGLGDATVTGLLARDQGALPSIEICAN